ncbi:iron sulfur assembly protein 1 [Tricharina praecox]|uniref:iron sulfur assembly protein 1 n=1 Tax=Tricharina praecox TaxID=43433 RepID=UPI00222059F5|nr:iron sulfur assembly protein 1 [Tricharina praecox]KAI5844804.1 iron sulfur assembly protein 1 [Tricharina praecox]
MPSLRRLAAPVMSLRRAVFTSATSSATTNSSPALRAAYSNSSSIGSSKRQLQTHTHTSPTLHTDVPMPRGSGVESSLTLPSREHSLSGAPPPAPTPLPASTASKPAPASAPVTRTRFRPRKAAMSLTSPAVAQLRGLMSDPTPKLIRVGVKNRGCSGLAYHLEYVDKPGKFDEEVLQDGVRVLIDSHALFSIIGSEMDWVEDKLSARFVFKNPNIKEQCGCGESFSIG